MSTKTTTHHTRRAPLSLSGGGKQQSQNHYSGKSADSNGNSNNSASAKNDNKNSASQKTESSVNDAKESTPKDLRKQQNTEKKQQQLSANNETVKKSEKTDEKKTQNGNGKAVANGGTKEKHQNVSEKQDNNGNSNGTNAKTNTTNSNGNSNAKSSNTKSNEKAAVTTSAKADTKAKEQNPAEPVEKSEKVSVKEKERENENEKEKEKEKEEEKEKKIENEQEKVVEKDMRSLRQEIAAAAEPEKMQLDKNETPKSENTKMEVTTPTSRSSATQAKPRTTPTTGVEKSGRSTPTRPVEKTSASPRNKIVTTVIDDVEMDPLAVESSPAKSKENTVPVAVTIAGPVLQPPAATSTPGKVPMSTQKTKTHIVDAKPDHEFNAFNSGNSSDTKSLSRTITHIGGRRSIRPLTEYTPSKFQSNLQFRESYRRINTELDVSSTTNTSMNVTVGSEIPNNSSFSFFGRGRKRDRTPPPQSQSAMELQTDADYSPPKRARLDIYTLFSVVSSPLTMLRSRFSRASIQSSTPMKLTSKLAATGEDEVDVQNVSGISIEEENAIDVADSDEKTATEEVTVDKNTDDDTTPKMDSPMKVDEKCGMEKGDDGNDELDASKSSNVNEVAAGIADTSVSSAKNKRCNIM